MVRKILITGGAGFIGSHLADELLRHGYCVRVLDNLLPQIHGIHCVRPTYLDPEVDLIVGDVRDADVVEKALRGIDAVYHFAAALGAGQSMNEIVEYTSINNLGTAVLLEALTRSAVERLIVASSMSVYGEGAYETPNGLPYIPKRRSLEQLRQGHWEVRTLDGIILKPLPTPETRLPDTTSVYALSKYDQECLCLLFGQTFHIPTVALRFFNVYGTRQSLFSPYTAVLALFASHYLNNEPPQIFEDGYQQRDFVHVYDAVRACRLALEIPEAGGRVFNIGSGQPCAIRSLAQEMADVLGKQHIQPQILSKYREGDIRHCFADISLARRMLSYEPEVTLREGLIELLSWPSSQLLVNEVGKASAEQASHSLAL